MRVIIHRIAEKKGYILFRRDKAPKGVTPWPLYFIENDSDVNDPYYKEFKFLQSAKKEFKKLTS